MEKYLICSLGTLDGLKDKCSEFGVKLMQVHFAGQGVSPMRRVGGKQFPLVNALVMGYEWNVEKWSKWNEGHDGNLVIWRKF